MKDYRGKILNKIYTFFQQKKKLLVQNSSQNTRSGLIFPSNSCYTIKILA